MPTTLPLAGLVVARLADRLATENVIYVASDEQRAAVVAAALAAGVPAATVLHLPSSDALPGDATPASAANTGRRLAALHALHERGTARIALVTTAEATARLYPPPAAFAGMLPTLAYGDDGAVDAVAAVLRDIGYADDERVDEPGTIAVRGATIDVFPADADLPARLEFDDGRITAIRRFDPITQLTTEAIDCFGVGRIDEPPLGAQPVLLFDHFADAAVALDPDAAVRRDRFLGLVADIVRAEPGTRGGVAAAGDWDAAIAARDAIDLDAGDTRAVPRFVENKAPLRNLTRAASGVLAAGGRIVVLGAPRNVRFIGARLGKALKLEAQHAGSWADVRAASPGTLTQLPMIVDAGWQEDGWFFLAAADILGGRAQLDTAAPPAAIALTAAPGMRVGDVVIHEGFGLAVVAGLEPLAVDDGGDAIVLEFAGGARRQIPVADADLIWRYGGEADAVTLDKLDGSTWAARRHDVDAAIAETARGLTNLATERAGRTTAAIDPDASAYERFAAGFPWLETADQARAIAAVRADLAGTTPVDRLIIGDVGYGKTEVALRAAALTALAGRQVAIAAPTTVLVRQHLETFRKRFAGTGIEVAGLSRLSTAAERKATKAGLADGSIGVVIGTAAVAAKGMLYRDLGLVVIDEEQRFGAADKARLRGLSDAAHLLTLTATPIPATLQSALVGLQHLSVIATPPARRQPISTVTSAFDPFAVRAALLREKARCGQSFVVVPRIDDMAAMRATLAGIVPELSFREAHGKLPAAEIDAAMVDFARGDGDVLLATNIIEAGLDVPRANTMIVWRADRFGLAQLHQLRGRVGRGGRRGQVLLLTDPDKSIAERTWRRLRTLETFDRLGAGFDISARDLDVRGAGDLLGETQAGHVKLIGVDLYQHLLEGALRTARGEVVHAWRCDMHLGVAGYLPADWIPDLDVRLELYARLARVRDDEGLDDLADEFEDRFGALPEAAATCLTIARIGVLACNAEIARIDAGPAAIALTPRPGRTLAGAGELVEKGGRYLLAERIDDPHARLERQRAVLAALDQ